jgi:hypothetical protein
MRKQPSNLVFRKTRHGSTSMTNRWSPKMFMRMVPGPVPASARSMGNKRPEGLSALNRSRSLSDISVTSPHSADANVTVAFAVPAAGDAVKTNAVAKAD